MSDEATGVPLSLKVRHAAASFELQRAERRMADVNAAIKKWMRDTGLIPPARPEDPA